MKLPQLTTAPDLEAPGNFATRDRFVNNRCLE